MSAISIFLLGLPAILVTIDFIKFLFTGTRLFKFGLIRGLEILTIIGLPLLYLIVLDESKNDCCSESATFSPDHKLTIYVLICICVVVYFYSTLKQSIKSPVVEVLINTILLIGLLFNLFIAVQVLQPTSLFGNLPIAILFIYQLINNQKLFIRHNEQHAIIAKNSFERLAWKILTLQPLLKFPVLLIICLPVLTVIICLLMLFGQKPDSVIRAFTDTYKHGFSQLDYLCENVSCGGHFLCSVAANGHKELVRPVRYGERNGGKIICNRQLLIANAFEELMEESFPGVHKTIRKNYNIIGNLIHQHYHIFENKVVSDIIYFLMKPLELLFLLILYTFDKNPENRIAKQYLSSSDKQKITEQLHYQ